MTNEQKETENGVSLTVPPRGLAILAMVGPSMVWAAEYIGSGEVILAPRAGTVLGAGIIWIVVITIFLKFWIGMCGARYTICTGEGMIDMFDRIPGPRHWAVWIVLVVQFVAATVSTGALATASGSFVSDLVGIDPNSALSLGGRPIALRSLCGWAVALFALGVAWSGRFSILKAVMSAFVLIMVISVMFIAVRVSPPASDLLENFMFRIPAVPDWAAVQTGINDSWEIVIPLLGWGAGGFASQVWYSYWVMGANYGMTKGRGYGRPADELALKNLGRSAAEKIRGWCRVMYTDATLALIIGTVVTCSFLVAGAGVLRPLQQVPAQDKVAETLSQMLSSKWGGVGRTLYLLAGSAALVSTLLGQLAGWPRLLADAFRICIPPIARVAPWKWQFRSFLLLFFCTNMVIVYAMGHNPLGVISLGAKLDGILLTPLQALAVTVGLYVVLPKLLSKEAYDTIKPSWVFAPVLILAAAFFGFLCAIQI